MAVHMNEIDYGWIFLGGESSTSSHLSSIQGHMLLFTGSLKTEASCSAGLPLAMKLKGTLDPLWDQIPD
jgi:hypothetical protein